MNIVRRLPIDLAVGDDSNGMDNGAQGKDEKSSC
jgi:hypothetical protein